jgi:hypothetical protein
MNLEPLKVYTIIPILSVTKSFDDPYIILSKQILVTKYSNPSIIHQFLIDKYSRTDDMFEFGDLQYF